MKIGIVGLLLPVVAASSGTGSFRRELRHEGDGGGGGGGGGNTVTCPDAGGYTGETDLRGTGPYAAPLRGTVACVDSPPSRQNQVAKLIYGPFEAGFSSDQLGQLFACQTQSSIPAGLDTYTAELLAEDVCGKAIDVLDDCGGHANPYHFHEKFGCLFSEDSNLNGHSSRIGTALDGNPVYGKYIEGGELPTNLDACGGRIGTHGALSGVYYYMVQDKPPFTIGCLAGQAGPVDLATCRSLYDSCGDDTTTIEIGGQSMQYDLDCPCFNQTTQSNVGTGVQDGGDLNSSFRMLASFSLVFLSLLLNI